VTRAKPRASGARPRRRGAGQARRPRTPLRSRIRHRLPSRGRVLAVLLAAALGSAMVAAVTGPWLRVEQVGHAGARFTPAAALDDMLAAYDGTPLLAVDSRDLAERIATLPAVERVEVSPRLPNALAVTVHEKEPDFTWQTRAAVLVGAADGTIIAELPRDAKPSPELAALPAVHDDRRASRRITVGDVLNAEELGTARRLIGLDASLLGSAAATFAVRLDDEHGFVLVCAEGGWEAALGVYGLDPRAEAGESERLLERQVAAIRTLFSVHPEGSVSWLDVRNPGKVFYRADASSPG
jgi:POTRA domain, FtsQ-type